jgi:hypothetical protein
VQDSHYNDNQALTSHVKRGKRNKRSFSKAFKGKKASTTPGHEHRKDISKIQCFRCDKYGHIARDCPVDIMVAAGGIIPPRVTLTRIEYSGKQEETLKH